MNNLKKELLSKNLEWLIQHDPDRFNFIEAFMRAIVNNEQISVNMSLNKANHTVNVRFGKYSYTEEFETLEDAMVLVNMAKCVKKEVA